MLESRRQVQIGPAQVRDVCVKFWHYFYWELIKSLNLPRCSARSLSFIGMHNVFCGDEHFVFVA